MLSECALSDGEGVLFSGNNYAITTEVPRNVGKAKSRGARTHPPRSNLASLHPSPPLPPEAAVAPQALPPAAGGGSHAAAPKPV